MRLGSRRALAGCAVLAAAGGAAVVVQGLVLATILADLVGGAGAPTGERLGVLAGAVLARAVFGWATQVVAARAATGAKEELRSRLLDHALAAGPEWTVAHGPAELTTVATRGLDALDAYFTGYLPALVNAAVLPLGVGAVILVADWPSAVIVAVTLPLIPLFAILIGLHTQDRVKESADTTERLAGHLLELVRALPVLSAFGRASAQTEAVRRSSDAHRRASMGTLRVAFASALALELIATLSVALVAVVIGLRLVSGDLALGVGLFVLLLAPECYLPLRAAGAAHHAAEDGLEAARRVTDLTTATTSTNCQTSPVELKQGGPLSIEWDFQSVVSPSCDGVLRVHELKVARRSGFAPDGVSFTAHPGAIVRLDSPSGSGKSSTFAVLLGFVPQAGGEVRVGATALTDLDLAQWRRRIAWVPQHPRFTEHTVADELGAGAREVAARVAADHLLDRPVGELSTGERQRVAVARALLRLERGADILLLDEPTAHLDPPTAARVMAAVQQAADAGAAVVLASHRRTTAADSDTPAAPKTRGATPQRANQKAPLWTPRLLAGAALGAAALIAGIALTALSAWLIAKASQQPPILTLSVAVVGVRTFGLARAGLRYAERLVTHDAAFRTAGELRVRLWRDLVRRGPAHTEGTERLAHDVDTVRDLTPRVLLPPAVALLVSVAAVAVQLVVLPPAAVALVIAVAAAGLGAPAVALAVDRHAAAALADGRRRLNSKVFALFDTVAELLAFGADAKARAELKRIDADLSRTARREAFGAGAAGFVVTLATGAAAVAGTWLAANAVVAGTLSPLLAPVVALVPLALAETLAQLPPAVQHREPLRAARGRLAIDQYEEPRERAGRDIVLRDVDARWPGGEPVLQNIDLDVPHGTHVAVVGPSGAGKSTLFALLLGFLPPENGTATLPARIAWCPQEPMLVVDHPAREPPRRRPRRDRSGADRRPPPGRARRLGPRHPPDRRRGDDLRRRGPADRARQGAARES